MDDHRPRALLYTGNASGEPTVTLDDGTVVARGQTVLVGRDEARRVLNPPDQPSAAAEDLDWVPGAKADV